MEDDGQLVVATTGAQLAPLYHSGEMPICAVPVMDIRDARASSVEETIQAAGGSFLFSGAFWLLVERLWTEGVNDPLILVCLVSMFAGGILAFAGYRQMLRRVSRLERYIPNDAEPKTGAGAE